MVMETGTTGSVKARYLRGRGLVCQRIDGGTFYYLHDGHGNVTQRVGADGNAAPEYRYDAFGNQKDPVSTDPNPFRYCGEYHDVETGEVYLRNWSYNPRSGRFTSEDPVRDGDNWYAYCGSNPVRYVDPLGLISVSSLTNSIKSYYNSDVYRITNSRRGSTSQKSSQGKQNNLLSSVHNFFTTVYRVVNTVTSLSLPSFSSSSYSLQSKGTGASGKLPYSLQYFAGNKQMSVAGICGYLYYDPFDNNNDNNENLNPDTGGQTYDLGKGWTARIDSENPGTGTKRHIHIEKGNKHWSQNDDGSPHDKNNNSSGSPPSKVLDAVLKKTGWDWRSKVESYSEQVEVTKLIGPSGSHTHISYPDGASTMLYGNAYGSEPTPQEIWEAYPRTNSGSSELSGPTVFPVNPFVPSPYPLPILNPVFAW